LNKLITNNQTSNFYNHITKLLSSCKSFTFNVAFINYSGLQLLLDTFKLCEEKGIKGKVLTSTYLNFTEAKALEKILEFENIELKIFDSSSIGFHSKAYVFEFEDDYKILLGSSNITASAFKSNIEWNSKTISQKDDEYLLSIQNEFEKLWENSFYVNKEFLNEYEAYKKEIVSTKAFEYKKTLNSNYMQNKALEKLDFLRKSGETKALAIAATGSGKTYLAAFDVKKYNPNKMLFIVHRENILIKAKESFERICPNKVCALYTGNKKEEGEYLFATIQTLSSNYEKFSKEHFDYIIVDEAHHITSPSYKKVCKYFEARFLLGLTATPNRMDEENIYEVFDENIACDIRLNDALEENLVVPFHYYGISDIKQIDYENIDIRKISELAKLLMINKRVEYIIEKLKFYGNSGNKRKALAFCSSKEHAFYMSEEFNKRGIKSQSLVSSDSIDKRENIIKELEDESNPLEVIFTVDIFNEGVDIPSINTVLMLRPTNSPIVFIQQLGRGLRKYKNKEFLTLLDFIGNHNKAYLIALALIGNKIIDKDSVKLSLLNNFANVPNAYISMDEISKQRILEQIDSENFSSFKYLKEQYLNFKSQFGKTPSLVDFISNDELVNPLNYISESKSYIEFVSKVEKKEELKAICESEIFIKAIRFIESLLPIKRVYEFVILKYLLENKTCSIKKIKNVLEKYLEKVCEETIFHSFRFLDQEFFDSGQIKRFLKLVTIKDEELYRSKTFETLLLNKKYKEVFEHSLNYGILKYEKSFGIKNYGLPFLKLYEKYNMLNIAQLCNFNKIHSSFRGSGFLKFQNNFFLFITIEKEEYSKASSYVNNFLNKKVFTYSSKPSHSSDKGDGLKLVNNRKENIKLHIFVRKSAQVDKKTQGFIYLGLGDTISYENNKPIECKIKLRKSLSDNLFDEFTKII